MVLPPRAVLREATDVELPTVLADAAGVLRPSRRRTTLTLHEVGPGETPTLFELGIPVVAHAGAWHIDVHQKVPLARSRDAATPAYLRAVHAAVLDTAADLLSARGGKAPWVTAALADTQPETLRAVVHMVYGDTAVIADPSCPEATKQAINVGRAVVHGGAYPSDVWDVIKDTGILHPAGHYLELRGDLQVLPDGAPPIPEREWRPSWRRVARYAAALCLELTVREIAVRIYRVRDPRFAGACSPAGELLLNVAELPRGWWTTETAINQLLIHEFAHLTVLDHLTDAFHNAWCRLGADLRDCETRLADFAGEVKAA